MEDVPADHEALDLLDYRRRVAEIYRDVRAGGPGRDTWARWTTARDELFRTHPQSAIAVDDRPSFTGLSYFEHDPAWRFDAEVSPIKSDSVDIGHSGQGATAFSPIGQVNLDINGTLVKLTLYWLNAYGGGVFVPFRDATSGQDTYGGGRYLLDTVKGADLGHDGSRVVLDFNYSYHPSCVHNYRWSCPLAPRDNWLEVPIPAGERL